MEKQVMTEPQEEFVADQSRPSVSGSGGEKPVDVHEAGKQPGKAEVFEPGVEG